MLRKAIWWPSGEGTGEERWRVGSAGSPEAGFSTAGGATTLTTKALCVSAPTLWTLAAKTMCVESGNHDGTPRSPVATVVVAAAPVRFLTRRLLRAESLRKYAIRLPDGAQLRALTGPVSTASWNRARSPTSYAHTS